MRVAEHRPELIGKAQTVLGPIDAERIGVAMTHEHLLLDASHLQREPQELDDIGAAIEEVFLYKRAGGSTLVDVTSVGLSRNPLGLAVIAGATGLNIIMGSSYYVAASHPADMAARTEDEIMDEIVRDVFHGANGTGIRAGIIGEVGCTTPHTEDEIKTLRASGRAQRITGAPLSIHPARHETSPREIVDVLRQVKADLSRTIIGHLERTIFRKSLLMELARTGCMLEYDLFGQENFYYRHIPNDAERIETIKRLIAEGHRDQIVISQDINNKCLLVSHGGPGYAHILENVIPKMRAMGVGEKDIEAMLIENPRRLLCFAKPKADSAAANHPTRAETGRYADGRDFSLAPSYYRDIPESRRSDRAELHPASPMARLHRDER